MAYRGRDPVAGSRPAAARLDHSHLGDFTLTDPLDAVFLQDTRIFHAVTAIRALGDNQVGRRDVAVITFRAEPLRLPSPD
jgi:hypothetical protein